MDADLACAEGDEGEIDDGGNVARVSDGDAIAWVLGASHESGPVVLESIAEDGECGSAKDGHDGTAAGCVVCSRAT